MATFLCTVLNVPNDGSTGDVLKASRVSEVLGLKWSDFDFNALTVTV